MSKRTPEHNAKIGESLRARGVGHSPTKRCPRCGKDLPREAFGVRANSGHSQSYCKPCVKADSAESSRRSYEKLRQDPERTAAHRKRIRDYQFKKKYGITVEEYDAMLESQSGVCAICKGSTTRMNLFVDHSHHANKVRALLCDLCNSMLGYARDDPAILRAGAAYIEQHTA